MNYQIIPSPDAEADINSAAWWYQRIETNLTLRFLKETDRTLSNISQSPYRFPRWGGGLRRALLRRFRYAIYFSLNTNAVFVIAVLHQRQDSVRIYRGNGRVE